MDLALQKAQEILLSFGVTGVGSMSTSLDDWNSFRRAADAGQLKVRLMVYLLGLGRSRSCLTQRLGYTMIVCAQLA